jgi:hypothetical protein
MQRRRDEGWIKNARLIMLVIEVTSIYIVSLKYMHKNILEHSETLLKFLEICDYKQIPI